MLAVLPCSISPLHLLPTSTVCMKLLAWPRLNSSRRLLPEPISMIRRDWLYLTFDSDRLGTSNCGARLRSAYCTTAPESSRRAERVFLSFDVSTAGLASAFFGFLAMLFLSVGGRGLL